MEILFWTIGISLYVIAMIIAIVTEGYKTMWAVICMIVGMSILNVCRNNGDNSPIKKQTYKAALVHNPYYIQADSVYRNGECIRIDTVYLKK